MENYCFKGIFIFKFILATLVFIPEIFPQVHYFEVGKRYTKAKFYLKDNRFIQAKNIIPLNDSTLKYVNLKSNEVQTVLHSNVEFILVKKGSFALSYGIAGATIGIIGVAFAHLQNVTNQDFVNTNWWMYYISSFALGATVGAPIGLLIPKWKRFYFKADSRLHVKIRLYPSLSRNKSFVNFSVMF